MKNFAVLGLVIGLSSASVFAQALKPAEVKPREAFVPGKAGKVTPSYMGPKQFEAPKAAKPSCDLMKSEASGLASLDTLARMVDGAKADGDVLTKASAISAVGELPANPELYNLPRLEFLANSRGLDGPATGGLVRLVKGFNVAQADAEVKAATGAAKKAKFLEKTANYLNVPLKNIEDVVNTCII